MAKDTSMPTFEQIKKVFLKGFDKIMKILEKVLKQETLDNITSIKNMVKDLLELED